VTKHCFLLKTWGGEIFCHFWLDCFSTKRSWNS